MEDINLHFTGDLHAIGAANNLLAAMLDNHIHQGNALRIDTSALPSGRAVDMERPPASEYCGRIRGKAGRYNPSGMDLISRWLLRVMAAFCLANDIMDLKERLARIIVAYDLTPAGNRRTVKGPGRHGSPLKDALKPNLVQSLEGTLPLCTAALCQYCPTDATSVIATKMGCKLADYMVTEAGFRSRPGAEKFVDIKCAACPGCVQMQLFWWKLIRAKKYNGGVPKADLNNENLEALEREFPTC